MKFTRKDALMLVMLLLVCLLHLTWSNWLVGIIALLAAAFYAFSIVYQKKVAEKKLPERIMKQRKTQLGYEVISQVEVPKEIKPTDIPNGFVVRAPSGKPALIDYDDKGNPQMENHVELSMDNWMTDLAVNGKMPEDVFILVHTVKGDERMLVKSLEVSHMHKDNKLISVREVARLGVLGTFAETIYKKYMERLQCGSTADNTTG